MLWSDGKWQLLTVYKVTILGEITSYLQVIQQSALENGDSGMFRLRMLVQFGMDESESEGALLLEGGEHHLVVKCWGSGTWTSKRIGKTNEFKVKDSIC